MNGQEAVEYIHSFRRFKKVPGLAPIRELLEALGRPQDRLRFLHVAGTNGKGSVCAMCASVLREAGCRTGLFISPYVLDFRERMQIDGEMIGEEKLGDLMERLLPVLEDMKDRGVSISEFEVVTAAGLFWFAEQKCDVVCLEVGLGGRFDATNVIDAPLASVVVSVGYDHTEILGDTLPKIAGEKCGIIKPGGTVVMGPGQPAEVLAVAMERCAETKSRLILPGLSSVEVLETGVFGSRIRYRGMELSIPLGGRHQISNCITAVEALEVLKTQGIAISEENITAGIKAARFPARMECFSKEPAVFLDGAHNPDGCQALALAMEEFPRERVRVVMGMLADKDIARSVQLIASRASFFWAVEPPCPRALGAEQLADAARRYCQRAWAAGSPSQALEEALKEAGEGDAVFFCGSLYLAAQLRPLLCKRFPNRQKTAE